MLRFLSPKIHPIISEFLMSEKENIFELVEAFGSPLHVIFPQIFEENVFAFKSILGKHGQENGSIYFAAKANKSESFLEAVTSTDIGVDVSSLQELRIALGHGINGKKISVSGSSKTPKLLLLAIQHECSISVDSLYELNLLIELLNNISIKRQPKVTIRLNNLSNDYSRFGISPKNLSEVYKKLLSQNCPVFFSGFAFHLSGYSINQRINAIQHVIQEITYARSIGFACDTINIGGGFTVNYIEEDDWNHFLLNKNENTFTSSKEIVHFYPYANQCSKEHFLDAILSASTATHKQLSENLFELGIRIAIEPGRSLLDQCGITCMSIKGTKSTSDGTIAVEVDANINHLSEQWFGSDYCVDPLHLRKFELIPSEPVRAIVAGNTCLEMDLLSKRKINFEFLPQVGDFLLYINTAGYQMDSNESDFHRIPIPAKIVAFKHKKKWKWKKDSEFSMLDNQTL